MTQTKRKFHSSMPKLNSLESLGTNSVSDANILIKSLNIEFEVRRSNLTDFYSHNALPTCICELRFDPENINELQSVGEIDQDANVVIEVISSDKRCIKTRTKEKPISWFLGKTVPQRLFTPDDVIQIQISNTCKENHCIQLKPIELPLSITGTYSHFI